MVEINFYESITNKELFEDLPNNWTYPYAHPKFIELAVNLVESLTLGDRLLDMNES